MTCQSSQKLVTPCNLSNVTVKLISILQMHPGGSTVLYDIKVGMDDEHHIFMSPISLRSTQPVKMLPTLFLVSTVTRSFLSRNTPAYKLEALLMKNLKLFHAVQENYRLYRTQNQHGSQTDISALIIMIAIGAFRRSLGSGWKKTSRRKL